jgi:NADPH-dependent glutamate synthase beta subunit-like oxidoreductase
MPAAHYEIEEALEEGVKMNFLVTPAAVEIKDGKKVLRCINMKLGEPDRSGRRRPIPIDGSYVEFEVDTVIGAVGQSTNTTFLYNDLPVKLNKWGDIEINGRTCQTSELNVFAGGDCVTGPATVVQAVGAGRAAAESMDSFLMKGYIKENVVDYSCSRAPWRICPNGNMKKCRGYRGRDAHPSRR